MGTCGADGMTCTCDEPAHRLPGELCAVWHASILAPGKNCAPGDRAYCNQTGVCAADGMLCICDDAGHRTPADKCAVWSPGLDSTSPYASVIDVTAATGARVTGPLVAWQLPDGPSNVEHLAGIDSYGDLINWWWKPGINWQVVNISKQTGVRLQAPLTTWMTTADGTATEHIAGVSPEGHLIETWWKPGLSAWQYADITAKTGVAVQPGLSAWLSPNAAVGTIERIAGRTAAGQLSVFSRNPGGDWTSSNVTSITGVEIAGSPTSWVMPDGDLLAEHVAARSTDGSLRVFYYRSDLGWQQVNVTAESGQTVADRVTAWTDASHEYLAGTTADNRLVLFSWSASNPHWSAVNVARDTGDATVGAPSSYRLTENGQTVTVLGARGNNSDLRLTWHTDKLDWQSLSLTDATTPMGTTRREIASDPVGWTTPDGTERIAARGPDDRVLVFSSHTKARQLTDGLSSPFMLKRTRTPRRILAILWRANEVGIPSPTRDTMRDAVFGTHDSAADYFRVISNGYSGFEEVDTVGWFDADYPPEHYFGGDDIGDTDGNGFIHGHVEKWTEAILKADATINFASYDVNQDGVLDGSELGIVIAMPSNNPYGTNRTPAASEYPTWEPLIVDGVRIPMIAEVYAGAPVNAPLFAHELGHLIYDLPDMYEGGAQVPDANGDLQDVAIPSYTYPGSYSLMDQTYYFTHLDALNKLKLGWLRPRVIFQAGQYSLANIESSSAAWALLDPTHGTDEYFLVENRNQATEYDRDIPNDGGLAVWHIMENAAVYGSFVPPGLVASNWNLLATWDWGRRAVQMIRPSRTLPRNEWQALWDGAQAGENFDLLSSNPDSTRGELRWANGVPSRFQITGISGAAATMTATVGIQP